MSSTVRIITPIPFLSLTDHSLGTDYYADLELPSTASLEDVRKAYRKLALQYHPDRNAGREEECVPKFQAIQQANEVLGDAAVKQKYDIDRRKAGLYPSTQPMGFTPRQPTPGNPYTATSAYPPPPRRTQPGTWQQRPQPAASTAANAGGTTGADRFSNFPRPSHPTAKKDHAQDRANMFQAWQNMNTPQNRQSRFGAQGNTQQTPPQPQPQPQPQTARSRPQPPPPPPRQPNTMPTEEQIRAGTKYRQPPPTPGVDGLNDRQKAWQAFEQNGPNKPGINRSNTTRTPKRQGFNPNTPGSDERAAPSPTGGYMHRNKSADFGRARQFPPPPPGAPPPGQVPTSPLSPKVSPTSTRPGTDPMRPDRTQVPYAEGNRNRTPYTSFIGERTDFGSDHLRRSNSTRDTSKLGPEDAANRNRARSSSPPRRESTATNQGGGKPFVMYSSSSAASSTSDMAQTPEGYDSAADKQRSGTAPDSSQNRPKRVPTAPSSRVNGSGAKSGATSPMPPNFDNTNVNGNATPAEGMQQKSKHNMYANPSPFDHKAWIAATFGSLSTSRAKQSRFRFPSWAIPGSVNPSLKRNKPAQVESLPYTTAADRVYICATDEERRAYIRFQVLLQEAFDHVPSNLDMTLFNTIVTFSRRGMPTGKPELDQVVARLLAEFPTIGSDSSDRNNNADEGLRANSFSFPNAPDMFASSAHKSRSAEHINTNFSPDGWNGPFTGEPGYFAASNGATKSRSPGRRPVSSRAASSQRRAATMDLPTPSGASSGEASQRPWGSDGQPKDMPPSHAGSSQGFSTADWQQKFQDPSWTMPPPPPNPPSPSKMGASAPGSRRPSRTLRAKKGQTFQSHVDGVTVEVEDDDGKHDSGGPNGEDFDAMDIDDTPPAQRKANQAYDSAPYPGDKDKEARLYSVPPSAWRQQQEQVQQPNRHRKTSSASRRAQRASTSSVTGAKLNTNLDDLRNVEPISRTAGPSVGGGFSNMSSMGEDLPFQSASAKSIPPETLKKLDLPDVPSSPELPRRWSKLSWHMYAEHFADYLKRQHDFNKKMLSYFAVRLQSDEQLIAADSKGWLEAKGVTQDGIGFDAYASDVGRDERMREAWNIGCERHRKAVKQFGESRDRVVSLAKAGSLPE